MGHAGPNALGSAFRPNARHWETLLPAPRDALAGMSTPGGDSINPPGDNARAVPPEVFDPGVFRATPAANPTAAAEASASEDHWLAPEDRLRAYGYTAREVASLSKPEMRQYLADHYDQLAARDFERQHLLRIARVKPQALPALAASVDKPDGVTAAQLGEVVRRAGHVGLETLAENFEELTGANGFSAKQVIDVASTRGGTAALLALKNLGPALLGEPYRQTRGQIVRVLTEQGGSRALATLHRHLTWRMGAPAASATTKS